MFRLRDLSLILLLEDYKPFISEGFVSLNGDNVNLRPIRILRDTGASQSLLLDGVLPLSEKDLNWCLCVDPGSRIGFY